MKATSYVLIAASAVFALAACTPTAGPSRGGPPRVTSPEPNTPTSIPTAQALPENVRPMPQESPTPAKTTTPCGTKDCAQGTECVTYYGIAGKAGGAMYSCEVRCKSDAQCPSGAPKCTTIADGPGQVCR